MTKEEAMLALIYVLRWRITDLVWDEMDRAFREGGLPRPSHIGALFEYGLATAS